MNNTEYLLDDILKAIGYNTAVMVDCTEQICKKLDEVMESNKAAEEWHVDIPLKHMSNEEYDRLVSEIKEVNDKRRQRKERGLIGGNV